jgi:hypothetical protein
MELTKRRLSILWMTGLFLTLFMPIFYPSAQIAFLAPFIMTVYYQKSYLTSLWISLVCGLILDILSFTGRMGMMGLSYTLASMILYKYRLHFFGDRQSTLPIMTFFFGVLSTIFLWSLSYAFEQNFVFSILSFLQELTLFPLFSAAYAYMAFIFPFAIPYKRTL